MVEVVAMVRARLLAFIEHKGTGTHTHMHSHTHTHTHTHTCVTHTRVIQASHKESKKERKKMVLSETHSGPCELGSCVLLGEKVSGPHSPRLRSSVRAVGANPPHAGRTACGCLCERVFDESLNLPQNIRGRVRGRMEDEGERETERRERERQTETRERERQR